MNYFYAILNASIPLSISTLLIVASYFIKDKNKRLSVYSKVIGIGVSVLSAYLILINIFGYLGQFF